MKKTLLLILILLVTAACSKKLNTIEQDYYTIIHDIVPLQEDFASKSSEPVYKLKDALEQGTVFDVDKTISDIEKVQTDIKNTITEKAKNIKSDIGKKYIAVKIEYIDSVCSFSIDMLNNFKNLQDKSMKTFVEILANDIAVSGNKIDNLLKEEEKLLEEIQNMVKK
ncbi:MAG: hypothetical protein K2N11_08360 [Mucispirillum sp.]|nr:hypothetical protein [Mucispirillum sp.]